MTYRIPGGGVVSLSFGHLMDLTFDYGSMRALAEISAVAVRDIEERATGEEPETSADEIAVA